MDELVRTPLRVIRRRIEGFSFAKVFLHPETGKAQHLAAGTLVQLLPTEIVAKIIYSDAVSKDTVMVSTELKDMPDYVQLEPSSGHMIVNQLFHKKLDGEKLSASDIRQLLRAIDTGAVEVAQLGALATLFEIKGLDPDETVEMATSIVEMSRPLEFAKKPVVDKHSIGGVAGNRITPIIVPIIAAAGLTIPKVSTRAITSPAGSIDAVEVVMPVDLSLEEMVRVVNKTGGCIVNGESVGIGRVMDKFIGVLKPLKLDPIPLMVASILSKKKLAGSQYVLIDLPTGEGSKLPRRRIARELAHEFSRVGYRMGLHVENVISPGIRPIGRMIGPALEMIEVFKVLENKFASRALIKKSLSLSGILLEMTGKAPRGAGYGIAEHILKKGKALEKFKEIIEAQGGDPSITSESIPKASYRHLVTADISDTVYTVRSSSLVKIARAAGAPWDRTAGVIIYVDHGDDINPGDPLFEIWAESESKIDAALYIAEQDPPVVLEKMVLEYIPMTVETEY